MRFQPGLSQNLHAPLLDLASALLALDENKIEPMLKPTPTRGGGRAPDSVARQALIGFAVGTVRRLQLTGLQRAAAHKAVADAQSSQNAAVAALTDSHRKFGEQQQEINRLADERNAAQTRSCT